jgi:hypothetical protein
MELKNHFRNYKYDATGKLKDPIQVKCSDCENKFETFYPFQKFCSTICRSKNNYKNNYKYKKNESKYKKKCVNCAKDFECIGNYNKKYCSEKCLKEFKSKRDKEHRKEFKKKERSCETCGKKIETGGIRYCSTKCKKERHVKTCIECGKLFKTSDLEQKLCSKSCSSKSNKSIYKNGCIKTKEQREMEFRIRFEKIYDQYRYVSGFVDSEKPVNIQCKKCEHIINRSAQIVRKKKTIQCDMCISINREENKIKKIEERTKKEEEKRKIKEEKKIELIKRRTIKCLECGTSFFSTRNKKNCSAACAKKRNNRFGEINKSKIFKNGRVDRDISLNRLARKHKNICAICGTKVNFKDFTLRGDIFIAGESYPSIDHIKPKSKGGTHTWENVQLAHMRCNNIKRDSDTYIGVGGQIVMAL